VYIFYFIALAYHSQYILKRILSYHPKSKIVCYWALTKEEYAINIIIPSSLPSHTKLATKIKWPANEKAALERAAIMY